MNNILKIRVRIWLILGLTAAALLTLAFQGGDTDPAHCRPCKPPTPTLTPTPTSTPSVLQACRISEIYLNEQLYQPGSVFTTPVDSPLEITLKLVDYQGQLLVGANVDATVTQTTTVQAAAVPPLEDQSGTYDAVYIPGNTGLFLFQFSASDLTGPRFLPCQAEALVEVVDDGPDPTPCAISLTSDRTQYTLGDPINLTATVTNTLCTNGVTAAIQIPGNGVVTRTLTGSANICTGSYTPEITGTFSISAIANSPGGTCDSNAIAPVVEATPPPTSTPTVGFNPPTQIVDLCGRPSSDITSTLQITGVTNLAGVDLSIIYDPTFVIPARITPRFGSGSVSQSGNTIHYTASSSTPVNGAAELLLITWRLQGRDGITTLALTSALRDAAGAPIGHIAQNGTLEIDISPPCLRCTVNLQGRADHSGATIISASGEQARSYPNGLFAIAATGELNLTAPGYLSAHMAAPLGPVGGATAVNTCRATLLAGDVNGDNTVNILDLANLAGHYQSADPTADLNANGIVDIFDLTLAAGNYQRQGQ